MAKTDAQLLAAAETGISAHLAAERDAGRITGTYYDDAISQTIPNLRKWLLAGELDRISPNLRDGLRAAIQDLRWEALTNAYSREVAFGTGGIREKMGSRRAEVLRLKNEGIHAPIIKGPNTINDVVLLLTSAGVARFGCGRKPPLRNIVIGFDSRVRGGDFARLIASLFLAYGFTVYLFDEACMYPSVTFAVPALKADIGVFISASHNDFRYNGYKLSCWNGSQFDPAERDNLYRNYIQTTKFSDIRTIPFSTTSPEKLWFIGGVKRTDEQLIEFGEHRGLPLGDPLPDVPAEHYAGRDDRIIDLHTLHMNHVKQFILRGDMIASASRRLSLGFSAFNGSGRKAVPRLLGEIGFNDVRRIMKLDPLDGMFPAFCSDPGKEQQPDPGDWRAADIAVDAFKEEYPAFWDQVDLLVGTDPDADRCGVIVKVPKKQRSAYLHRGTSQPREYSLLSADEAWTLILWYRLQHDIEKFGRVPDAERKFIVLSHTTTDLLTCLARKHGLGVLKTWVGFAQLAAGTRAMWDLSLGKDTPGITDGLRLPAYDEGRTRLSEPRCNRTIHSWIAMDDVRRSINVAALEQSNGFTLLGDVPPDERSLGRGGHVRDKDGTFAAVLVAELAQYAKEQGTNLIDLMDEKIYSDPDIGLYVTHYEPDPIDGEYEGLAGYTKKREILNKAEMLFDTVKKAGQKNHNGQDSKPGQPSKLALGGLSVVGATVYPTGKYDAINYPGFPDEGYRFYFDADRKSHLTIRPSGTSNALRFHVQLFGGTPERIDLIDKKASLRAMAIQAVEDIRKHIGATT